MAEKIPLVLKEDQPALSSFAYDKAQDDYDIKPVYDEDGRKVRTRNEDGEIARNPKDAEGWDWYADYAAENRGGIGQNYMAFDGPFVNGGGNDFAHYGFATYDEYKKDIEARNPGAVWGTGKYGETTYTQPKGKVFTANWHPPKLTGDSGGWMEKNGWMLPLLAAGGAFAFGELGAAAGTTAASEMGALSGIEGAGGAFDATGLVSGTADLAAPVIYGGEAATGGLTAAELASQGLDPITTGQAVNPWTTNPSLAELGGTATSTTSPGLWEQLKQLWSGTPPTGVPGSSNNNNSSSLGSLVSGALSVGSGIYGLTESERIKKAAELAALKSDPFGASGGRGMADAQLRALMADPSQVAANDPAYKLRIQAAQRAMASHGQNSGAMAVAGANASTDWYNGRLQQLGYLAGAGFNPASAQSIGLQGMQSAAGLGGQSLASIGYGVNTALGGTNSNNALLAQLAALLKQRG